MEKVLMVIVLSVIALSIVLNIVFAIVNAIQKQKKKKQMAAQRKELLQKMRDNKLISNKTYQKISSMSERGQINNINYMYEQIRQSQHLMAMMDLNMSQLEEQRRAATGMEFGGYNSDPNLNPGMQMAQQQMDQMANQQAMDSLNAINDLNNMNNMGMF